MRGTPTTSPLLGPLPTDDAGRDRRTARAARIEAYREEWTAPVDQFIDPPVDHAERRAWDKSVRPALIATHIRAPEQDRSRGLGIEP